MEKIIYQDLELCESEIVSEWKKELKEKYPDCNEEENLVTIYDDIYYKLEQTYKTIKKINLPDTILCIGKIESGNDTEVEYKEYPTLNKCCLFPVEKGLVKSYIDEYGNVRADLHRTFKVVSAGLADHILLHIAVAVVAVELLLIA